MSLRRSPSAHGMRRILATAALVLWSGGLYAQRAPSRSEQPAPAEQPAPSEETLSFQADELIGDFRSGLAQAAVRLPIAALLGTLLALRPRRAASPPRDPAVIETQIVLAIVGALIMLIVGASLARAFGIAGAANLIRYRAKIEDPKDAVVMLSTLAVGLASGVGLFGMAAASTLFIAVTLWIIEGFEHRVRTFLLVAKLGPKTSARRAEVERLLKKGGTLFELRSTGDEELSYLVNAGASLKTERLTAALSALAPDGKAQIEWREEKNARPLAGKEAE
jgi:MgtC family